MVCCLCTLRPFLPILRRRASSPLDSLPAHMSGCLAAQEACAAMQPHTHHTLVVLQPQQVQLTP